MGGVDEVHAWTSESGVEDDYDQEFLTEVLALLASPSDHVRQQSVTPTKKPYAIGSAARRKRVIDALRHEEKQLTHELNTLRSACSMPLESAKYRASLERIKRRRAEQEHTELRQAITQQAHFLQLFRQSLGVAPEHLFMEPARILREIQRRVVHWWWNQVDKRHGGMWAFIRSFVC